MPSYQWSDWYAIWGWFLWIGMIFLFFMSAVTLRYTYRTHKRYSGFVPKKDAIDILDERYARGEIEHDEYERRKTSIMSEKWPPPAKARQGKAA